MKRCRCRAYRRGKSFRPVLSVVVLPVFLFFAAAAGVYSQDDPIHAYLSGGKDSAVADRYALWAKSAIDQGLWSEALAGLERASDFADVSSDISYLLALARSHENKGRRPVLEALERSLTVDRWKIYKSESARLMKAENLIALRAYPQALAELSRAGRSPEEAVLTLKALVFFKPDEFLRYMTETLDRYPREIGPVQVFLNYLKNKDAAGGNPGYNRNQTVPLSQAGKDDIDLLNLIIRRLPVLLLKDPELAWMAAPFIQDRDEARRLVSAYRAVNKPARASLPITLALGLIDDENALEDLFSTGGEAVLDIALLDEIWGLLRREETRAVFRRNLLAFSGVIKEDTDRDGIPETSVKYDRGVPELCSYDADQDGEPDITLCFEAGDPVRAQVYIPPDSNRAAELQAGSGMAAVQWERYPAVLEVELDGVRYIPRPLEFNFSPFQFIELWGSGLLFPRRDPFSPSLTRRVLVSSVLHIERPSLEFPGGREVVELSQGIPVMAREYVGDLMVSETEFLRGRPQFQRLDLNLNGRFDMYRHFRRNYRAMELEDLWNYDRDFDYTLKTEEE